VFPSHDRWGTVTIEYINNANDIGVIFDDTGHRKSFAKHNIKNGFIKDRMRPVFHGVGFLGEGPYPKHVDLSKDTAYGCWKQILNRCYNRDATSYKAYGARGVSICDEWRNFQQFAEWYEKNFKSGMKLDKDILIRNNKVYSPATCRFVPEKVNAIVRTKDSKKKTGFAKGVRKNNNSVSKPFTAQVGLESGNTHIGCFPSMHLAFLAYKSEREAYIKRVAQREFENGTIDFEIYNVLMNWEVYPY